MNTARTVFAIGLVAALTAGCFRQDIRTITVRVPQMKSPECSKVIQDALGRIEGIVTAQPDLSAGTIDVTFDSRKLANKNVEYLIAGLGFDANDLRGKPEARASLPAECR